MGKRKPDVIKGTLGVLTLKALSPGPTHGWGISERIQQISKDELTLNQGSLYVSLHKLNPEGWIGSFWRVTENDRPSRHHALTGAGERQLGIEAERWIRVTTAVERFMATS